MLSAFPAAHVLVSREPASRGSWIAALPCSALPCPALRCAALTASGLGWTCLPSTVIAQGSSKTVTLDMRLCCCSQTGTRSNLAYLMIRAMLPHVARVTESCPLHPCDILCRLARLTPACRCCSDAAAAPLGQPYAHEHELVTFKVRQRRVMAIGLAAKWQSSSCILRIPLGHAAKIHARDIVAPGPRRSPPPPSHPHGDIPPLPPRKATGDIGSQPGAHAVMSRSMIEWGLERLLA